MKSHHHTFDIHIAQKYGVHEAILIHHFQHWIQVNVNMNKHHHEGRTWSYQTLEYVAAHFPYLSRDQVNRILRKLVRLNVLKKGNFNKNRYDRTTWFSFVNEDEFIHKRQIDMAKSPNGDDEIATPIPDTKPNTKTEDNICCPVDIATALRPTLNLSSFQFDNVKEEWLEKQRCAFPHVDLTQEILRAEAWCMNHPSKAKKRKRWDLFLHNWFQLEEERFNAKKDRSSHSQSNSVDQFAEHKRYAAKVKIALEKHRVKHDAKIYKDAFVDNVNGIEMSFYASFEEFKSYLVRKYEIGEGDLDD